MAGKATKASVGEPSYGNYLAGFGGDSYDMYRDCEHAVVHGSVFYPIFVNIKKTVTHKLNVSVQLRFSLTQHYRDKGLMLGLIKYFQCRYISRREEVLDLKVTKLSDIINKIIPFFSKK